MNKYDKRHIANVRRYQRQVDAIYKEAVEQAALRAAGLPVPEDYIFNFDDFPALKMQIDALMSKMQADLEMTMTNGIRTEWDLANAKNDALVSSALGQAAGLARYNRTHEDALSAFLARKERGLNLSDRVWQYTKQFKGELEMGLDLGIREGMDAASMARQLKQYLQFPDMLFRRVRDEHGVLHLSKRAAEFHPGQGVYRSSYKNARRLAATETNIAYRTSDHERWKDLDFIVGIEIHLSNNHTCLNSKGKPVPFFDICDELQGKYPKEFKFVGWHPHCRCIATPILKTKAELDADDERIKRGEEPIDPNESENAVKELPDQFKTWMDDNAERIENAKSTPYFLADNEALISRPAYDDGLTEEQRKQVAALEFEDNDNKTIQRISAPYDRIIEDDYGVGITFDNYTSGSAEINDVARNGKLTFHSWNSNDVDEWKDVIREIDKAIEDAPGLRESVDLFRGSTTLGDFHISGKSIDEINQMIGETFTDNGFTSFSFKESVAEKIASSDEDFLITLKAQRGLKGFSLANTSSYNTIERQEEFLLARGTNFEILGAKMYKGRKVLFVKAVK